VVGYERPELDEDSAAEEDHQEEMAFGKAQEHIFEFDLHFYERQIMTTKPGEADRFANCKCS